jgi:hypothetical protein
MFSFSLNNLRLCGGEGGSVWFDYLSVIAGLINLTLTQSHTQSLSRFNGFDHLQQQLFHIL